MSGLISYQMLSGRSGHIGSLPYFYAKGCGSGVNSSRSDYELESWTYSDQGGGASFNATTGRFYAKVPGQYFFTAQFMKTNRGPVVRGYIRRNNESPSSINASIQARMHGEDADVGDGSNYTMTSVQTTFWLNQDDYVSCWTSTGYLSAEHEYCTFTGQFLARY